MEQQEVLKLEFQWLLTDEFPSVLKQLKSLLQISNKKFATTPDHPKGVHVNRSNNFLLSLPHSDAVKGLINLTGDSIVKAELRFKFPKLSNPTFASFIFEQCPWKLRQLQDARNHLEAALNKILELETCNKISSGKQVIQLMGSTMSSLSRAKKCLIVPERQPLNDTMTLNAQKVLNPPVPDDLLLTFHVNCDKLVMFVYILNITTTNPNHKNLSQDSHAIGFTFEHNGRWFEVINKVEIVCTAPWLKDLIVWLNTAQQLCQQLKDKIAIFQTLLPDCITEEKPI